MTTWKDLVAHDSRDGGPFFALDGEGDDAKATGPNARGWFYPRYDKAKKVRVNVIVVQDDERGTNQVDGDGVTFNNEKTRAYRRSIQIECQATLDITEPPPPTNPDVFKLDDDDTVWIVKAIDGRDEVTMTVRCVDRDVTEQRRQDRVG